MSTETLDRPVAAAPVIALTPAQRAVVALNTAAYEINLRELVQSSCRIVAITNKAGREECHSAAMSLTRTLVDIDKTGKSAREDANAFRDAVIAEVKRLVAIGAPEKERLLSLRDTFDAAEQARKDALIAAERARVEAIQADIQSIRDLVTKAAGKPSNATAAAIEVLRLVQMTGGRFEEFADAAIQAVAQAGDTLGEMYDAAEKSEAAALAAEQARIAELARLEAQRVENARVAAENERIANEQAKERQRLADLAAAQEAAAAELRRKAEANLKAERDAQELAMRLAREKEAAAQAERDRVAADLKRQMDEQQAAIAAERKALEDEKAAAIRLADDHAAALIENDERDTLAAANAEALAMNATIDAAIASIEPDDLARCTQVAQAMLTNGRSLALPVRYDLRDEMIDSGFDDIELSDAEIAAMGEEVGLTPLAWVERLEAFTVRARAEMLEVA